MAFVFTSERVSERLPDIVVCDRLVTTGQIVLAGEVSTTTYLDVQTRALQILGFIYD